MSETLVVRPDEFSPLAERAELTLVSLRLEPGFSREDYLDYGRLLFGFASRQNWWIGDYLAQGEAALGEDYAQATAIAEELGLNPDRLRQAQWVAERVTQVTRRVDLDWTYHRYVAALDPEEQEWWLAEAAENGWSANDLREAIRESQQQETPPLPPETYRTIVVDPPWPIEKILRDVRPRQDQVDYGVLSLEEIEALDVPSLAAPDGCHLYLWTTHSFLPAAIRIAEAWGFRYQCLMTWVKNVGMTPFSWMYSTEHVVFARCGDLPLERNGLRLDFSAKATGHSRKPDEFFDLVKQASPSPRLSMYERHLREGFDSWGAESPAA